MIPTQDITAGQPYYDSIVNQTGCASGSDTLACLRTIPYQTLLDAVNQTPSVFSYMSLRLAFGPWTDGVFLTENAQDLLAKRDYTKVSYPPPVQWDDTDMKQYSCRFVSAPSRLLIYFSTNVNYV